MLPLRMASGTGTINDNDNLPTIPMWVALFDIGLTVGCDR